MSIRNLENLFCPASVAVVGASARPNSLGRAVFDNLREGGFKGALYPVNPHAGTIDGSPIYSHISDLPEAPDLAVILTPPDTVAGVVAELGERGCRAGVVLTAGFGEGGAAEGQARRSAVLAAARPYLFRIVGPNCLGILVPGLGLNASFARTPPLPGGLALVAQSGAIASTLLDWGRPRGIGFSHVVTVGDMIDVDFGDMLDYLAADENTTAILLYIEGLTHARKFMSAARHAARLKPVLAIKAGRHSESAKVATSHTGALAGSDAVYDAVFARAGLMRVDDLDDLFASAELLMAAPALVGDRLTIITNGGGLGVLAADRVIAEHGRLAPLSPQLAERLDAVLPPTWSHGNPIDVIGDADAARYGAAVRATLEDPETDAVLAMYCPTLTGDPSAIASAVADSTAVAPGKAVLAAWTGEASILEARKIFADKRVPSFATPGEAVKGFMSLVRYRRLQDLLMEVPPPAQDVSLAAVSDAKALLAQITDAGWLPPIQVRRILELYGIPCNRAALAGTPEEAGEIARSWNLRAALKIVSPDITHKSDVGGVRLDVEAGAVATSASEMIDEVRRHAPRARIKGVLVEEMIKRPRAHELFLGVTVDRTFGPVLAFGHGGTGIEIIDDKAFGFPPLNLRLAEHMIRSTRVGRLLAGYRDRPAANIAAIAQALVSLSQLLADHPQIVDLDINPLLADENGIVAVDARIKVDPSIADSALIITPYPREHEGQITPKTAPMLIVRPVKPQDEPSLYELVKDGAHENPHLRLPGAPSAGDRRLAARLTQIDYDREMVLIARPPGESDGAWALAWYHADPDNIEAECTLLVRPDKRRQGIGLALMAYLIEIARVRGLRRISGIVSRDNAAMESLARSLGMKEGGADEGGETRLLLDLG